MWDENQSLTLRCIMRRRDTSQNVSSNFVGFIYFPCHHYALPISLFYPLMNYPPPTAPFFISYILRLGYFPIPFFHAFLFWFVWEELFLQGLHIWLRVLCGCVSWIDCVGTYSRCFHKLFTGVKQISTDICDDLFIIHFFSIKYNIRYDSVDFFL